MAKGPGYLKNSKDMTTPPFLKVEHHGKMSQELRGLPPLPPWEPESQVEVCRCGGVERVESFPKDMMMGGLLCLFVLFLFVPKAKIHAIKML